MSKEQYQAVYSDAAQNPGPASRKEAERQIVEGVLRGYLAYVDGVSIGWCNANDRANYPAEPVYDDTPFYALTENREKAVICFEIAPEFRGKGVATALLQRVVDDAKAEGYVAVVSFPFVRNERYEWDCCGPLRLYEKADFSKVSEKDGRAIMRKELA
ncbi:MAG: GNAT family N-acetyltransferase, partial [Oscillospiraceae bacterium]|jgi:GNAT superfamily N-acetyltransferase|nr:GNAT family N-acetyltransferase [Oscillospiraceae bacterium]